MLVRRLLAAAVLAAQIAAPLPAMAQESGALIDSRPMANAPNGIRAWRVRYWTEGPRGRPVQVTGIVAAPDRPSRGPRDVIAWTHGAWGVAERCAPSLSDNFWRASPMIGEAVRAGYTVIAPDYIGLGAEGMHPFLVGEPTAHAVLDAVRAGRQVRGADAGIRFAVWGESQGGNAALWTAHLARRYAPDLDLVGAAAIVPPTDLGRNLAEASDQNARALLTAFTAHSWSELYGAPLSVFGNRNIQGVVTRLAQNNCVTLGSSPRIGTILGVLAVRQALRRVDLNREPTWRRLLATNAVPTTGYSSPLLVAPGQADTIVAPAVTRDWVRRACRSSLAIRYMPIAGGTHVGTTGQTSAEVLRWLEGRFRGGSAPNDCSRVVRS